MDLVQLDCNISKSHSCVRRIGHYFDSFQDARFHTKYRDRNISKGKNNYINMDGSHWDITMEAAGGGYCTFR